MMKPPMPTFSPVWTRIRVERLTACAAGVGAAVGVGVAGGGVGVVPAGRTVVDAVKKLLAGLGSITEAWAEAVLLSGPATVGVTTKVTVALPGARVPRLQVMELVPLQLPWLGVTETKFTLAGKVSPIITFGALEGPLLDTVMV